MQISPLALAPAASSTPNAAVPPLQDRTPRPAGLDPIERASVDELRATCAFEPSPMTTNGASMRTCMCPSPNLRSRAFRRAT